VREVRKHCPVCGDDKGLMFYEQRNDVLQKVKFGHDYQWQLLYVEGLSPYRAK